MKYLTRGNTKVKALIFDLPTSVCLKSCRGCYAQKSEKRFPNVIKKRNNNYNASLLEGFSDAIIRDLNKSKKHKIVRIHSSGDFFSQDYINKWHYIISSNKDVMFYAYTKNLDLFDFSVIKDNRNFNLINSITPNGNNYGSLDYCQDLVDNHNYFLCPCHTGDIKCMVDCNVCLTADKVCFVQH